MPVGVAAWAVALLAWFVIGMLPGFLVATALRPSASLVDRWAVSPLVSIGVAFGIAAWVDRFRPGWGLPSAVVALLAASLVSLVVCLRGVGRIALRPSRWTRSHAVVAGAVVVSLAMDALVVGRSRSAWGSVVPWYDGNAHGYFVARILLTHSVDPVVVSAYDTVSGTGGSLYPLGMHTLAALVSQVTNVDAGLTVVAFLAGSVWAPLGILSWGRRVAGQTEATTAAVILAVATPWFLMSQVYWGFWPLLVAVALVPACALVVITAGPRWRLLLPMLAVSGLFSVHVVEVLVVAMLVGLTLLLDSGPPRERVRATLWGGVAGVAGCLVLLPLSSTGATASKLLQVTNETKLSPAAAVAELIVRPAMGHVPGDLPVLVALASVVWWAILLVGSRLLWRTSASRGTVVSVWALLALALSAFLGVAEVLSSPWYSSGYRLMAQAVALAALPLGVGTLAVVRVARTAGHRRGVAAVALGVVLLSGLVVMGQSVRAGNESMTTSVVTADDRAAFDWLAARVEPGERVLNQTSDGTAWAYPHTRGVVSTVFGRLRGQEVLAPEWADRDYLLTHVTAWATDPAVREAARRWDVRYVVVGDRRLSGSQPVLNPAALAAAPGVRLVFRSGDAYVFELTGA
jgi:hypothetical protein